MKKNHGKVKRGLGEMRALREREGAERFLFFIFSSLRFFLRSTEIGP